MNELEKIDEPKKRCGCAKRIADLERRIKYCEGVAKQYEQMYAQLERKFQVMNDRQNNIQAVYDYMTQIGSTLVRKKASSHTFLNPLNALEEKDLQIENKGFVHDANEDV